MEERILDDEESRRIKLKRTENGETDAVEETGEDVEVEVSGEYDEDLVGLTPSQLEEAIEKRERALREAREESLKLTAEAETLSAAEKYGEAEPLFAQALLLDGDNDAARRGLWVSRTRNFTDDEAFFKDNAAEELASDEKALAFVLPEVGSRLRGLQRQYAAEESELRPSVEEEQNKRREAFAANKRYYGIRLGVFAVLALLFAVGIAVSADNILRTASDLPLILVGVFGGLTLAAFIVAAIYARKFYLACGYVRENEKLSSTEEGARLEFLQTRLAALAEILHTEE